MLLAQAPQAGLIEGDRVSTSTDAILGQILEGEREIAGKSIYPGPWPNSVRDRGPHLWVTLSELPLAERGISLKCRRSQHPIPVGKAMPTPRSG
ncbi:MAG: hypothetical protein IGR92_01730 [Leptolyngbyaceae cyanobacterium T60_A2020_046]|nr:hypothetical protein [Leptolyngbyaceae cyanobacterium T60_A2020_046]